MTTNHCGDTCGLIDFTMAVAGDRLLPEERMKLAIEAVTSGKMSQRGAAQKYDVVRDTLQRRLKQAADSGHPTKAKSQPAISPISTDQTPIAKLSSNQKRSQLAALCTTHGIKRREHKGVPGAMRKLLHERGIEIPPELGGAISAPTSSSSQESRHDADTQGVPANDPRPVVSDRPSEADQDDDPLLDERIDVAKLNQRILQDVLKSERSDSFKRAVQLLTELEGLVVTCWYGRDNWSGQDWVHVNSQVKTIQSLAGQRAEEAHRAFFQGCDSEDGAITV